MKNEKVVPSCLLLNRIFAFSFIDKCWTLQLNYGILFNELYQMASHKHRTPSQCTHDIGLALTKLRIGSGYETAQDFASKNGLAKIYYARIEDGGTNITIKLLYKILAIHSVDLCDFFEAMYSHRR